MRTDKLTEHRNIIFSFLNGAFLGWGINYYFSYEVMTHPFSIDFYASLILVVVPLMLLLLCARAFLEIRRQEIKAILLGIAFVSTIFAVFSFGQNLAWFLSRGYLTNVYAPDGHGGYLRITVYPPELIYNLVKAIFIASVSSFMERIIKIAE